MPSFSLTTARPERRIALIAFLIAAALACAHLIVRESDGAPQTARAWFGFLHAPPSDADAGAPAPATPAARPDLQRAGAPGSAWPW